MTTSVIVEENVIPNGMQALYLPAYTSDDNQISPTPSSLVYSSSFPVPTPSPSQYLIRVQAAALCPGELACGFDVSTSKAIVPGHEFCGRIVSTPSEEVDQAIPPRFQVGDEVFGLLSFAQPLGAAADYTVATESELARKPRNVSAAEAATIPLSALAAYQPFFGAGGLDPDDGPSNRPADGPLRVLITNASDDVGAQAIRLLRSRSLFPSHVHGMMGGSTGGERPVWIAAMGYKDDLDFLLRDLGVDAATASTDVAAAFQENAWEPVDMVFDCMGGATLREVASPVVVRNNGHIITVCAPVVDQNRPAVQDEMAEIQHRQLHFEQVVVAPNTEHLQKISLLVERGELKPSVHSVLDLIDGKEGMSRAERKSKRGKVVLRADPAIN